MNSEPLSIIIRKSKKSNVSVSAVSKIETLKSQLEKQNLEIVHLENLDQLVINTTVEQWANLTKEIEDIKIDDFEIIENSISQNITLPLTPFPPSFSLRRVAMAANSDDPWIQWHEHLMHWVDEACDIIIQDQLKSPTKILDIATGTGGPIFSLLQAFPNCNIQACDINKNLLEIGSILAEESNHENLHFTVANAENLKYAENSFDLVTCFFSFMYFENPAKVLEEIQRVIIPNNKAYIVTWGKRNTLFELIMKVINWNPEFEYQDDKNPLAYSDSQNIIDLLQDKELEDYNINNHVINMKWKGSAFELWEFFKSSNKAVSMHLIKLDTAEKKRIEQEITNELEKMKEGQFINIPVDIIVTSIQF